MCNVKLQCSRFGRSRSGPDDQETVFMVILFAGLLCSGDPALSQDQFYRGRLLRIIVGFPPGGGYDTYARILARHMGKHIPGNPTIAVDNMSGAGSMISANHIYRVAKPDGLTLGHFIGGLFLQQILGKPGIEFDARKFEYVGAPAQDNLSSVFHKAPASRVCSNGQRLRPWSSLAALVLAPEQTISLRWCGRYWVCRSKSSPATKALRISVWHSITARFTVSATLGSRRARPGATKWTRDNSNILLHCLPSPTPS